MRSSLSAFVILFMPGLAAAETLLCPDPLFTIEAADPAVAARGCDAAALAQATMATCGLALARPLSIRIAPALSSPGCVGIYHCGADRVEVLSPEAVDSIEIGAPFAGVSRDGYWDSVVVHEIAHAAYDAVDCPFSACIGTAEYFAYGIQIGALSVPDRRAFETAAGVEGKVSRERLSGIVAMMAPGRFAGLAWAHLQQRPDRCDYLRLIMAGRIYFDSEHP